MHRRAHYSLPSTALFSLLFASLLAHFFFFFNDTATTEIYTLSLHDALPISRQCPGEVRRSPAYRRPTGNVVGPRQVRRAPAEDHRARDRKSTRLNSSHT